MDFRRPEKSPLRVTVDGGNVLVIKIGIKTLALAFERAESNNPYNHDSGEYETQFTVSNPLIFACDVRNALRDEGEDGSTVITRLLDEACNKAVDNGSTGIRSECYED